MDLINDVYTEYMEWVEQVSEDLPEKGTFEPEEIVAKVTELTVDKLNLSRVGEDKVLIMTTGLPRSGKSTWAKRQGLPMVNPDAIRLALHGQPFHGPAEDFVWAHAKLQVRSQFQAGHNRVLFDATNTTAKRREFWREPKEWSRLIIQFETPLETCIDRLTAENHYLDDVIVRMAADWENVTDAELDVGDGIRFSDFKGECHDLAFFDL